jgi:hypothetical protein
VSIIGNQIECPTGVVAGSATDIVIIGNKWAATTKISGTPGGRSFTENGSQFNFTGSAVHIAGGPPSLYLDGSSGVNRVRYTTSGGAISSSFALRDETAGVDRLTIDANGHVGINRTSPIGTPASGTRHLTLIGTTGSSVFEGGTGEADADGVVLRRDFGSDVNASSNKEATMIRHVLSGATSNARGGKFEFWTKVNNGTLTLAATIANDQTLDVVGIYKKNGTNGVTHTMSGSITALATTGGIVTTFTSSSDERLKDILGLWAPWRESGTARGMLRGIRPITYRWNDVAREYHTRTGSALYEGDLIGWSAQNIAEHLPGATGRERWDDGREWKTVDDRAILGATVTAVQELDRETEDIRGQIDALTARLTDLETRRN